MSSGGATVVLVVDAPVSAAVTAVVVGVDDSFLAEVLSTGASFFSVRTGLLRVTAVVVDVFAACFLLVGGAACFCGGNNGGIRTCCSLMVIAGGVDEAEVGVGTVVVAVAGT